MRIILLSRFRKTLCSFLRDFCFHLASFLSCPSSVKKATIYQVTTMLATSKNVQFPGHSHLLTTGTDDPSLAHWRSGDNQSVRSSEPVVSRWLWPGNRTFLEVASMIVSWWIVAFLCSVHSHIFLSLLLTCIPIMLCGFGSTPMQL